MLFLKSIERLGSKFLYALFISVFLIGTPQIYAETESSTNDLNEVSIEKEGLEEIFNISDSPTSYQSTEADGDPIPEQTSCTTCITVSSGTDDAEGWEDGTTFLNSSDLELVHDDDYGDTGHRGNQTVGIRFNSVDVP